MLLIAKQRRPTIIIVRLGTLRAIIIPIKLRRKRKRRLLLRLAKL